MQDIPVGILVDSNIVCIPAHLTPLHESTRSDIVSTMHPRTTMSRYFCASFHSCDVATTHHCALFHLFLGRLPKGACRVRASMNLMSSFVVLITIVLLQDANVIKALATSRPPILRRHCHRLETTVRRHLHLIRRCCTVPSFLFHLIKVRASTFAAQT